MISAILIVIGILCAIGILFIVWRKFSLVARIDVERIQEEHESRLKKKLIEERLYRKWHVISAFFSKWLSPSFGRMKSEFHRWLSAIQTKERTLRVEQLKREPDQASSFGHVRPQVESMIASENYTEAESRLIEFIALHPKHVEAYKLLANVAIGKKDYRQAQEIYEFVLKLDEKSKDTYSALGRLYSQGNKSEKAREMFERSVSLHSTDGSDYSSLAKLYQATGELERAFDAIKKACELQPQNPKFLDKLAELAILLGRRVIAKNAYGKLKKVNPENEKLASIREQIDAMK